MNRMNKDEFKNAMRAAKVEEEINEILKDIDDPIEDDLIEDPEDLPVENPEETGKKRRKTAKTVPNRQKSALNGIKTSKTASVAAEQKPRKKPGPKPKNKAVKIENKDEEITIKTLNEVMDKAARQKEALQVAISIMAEKTDRIIIEAGKMVNLAELYNGYMETLEEMTE